MSGQSNAKYLIPSSELVEKITNDIIDNANANNYTLNEGILDIWDDIKKNGELNDITFKKHNKNTIEYTIWFKRKKKSAISVKQKIPIKQNDIAEFKQKVVQSITHKLFGENNNNISQYLKDKDELNIYYYNNLIKPDVLNLYKINLKNNEETREILTDTSELDAIISDRISLKPKEKTFNLIIFLKEKKQMSNRVTVIGGKKRKRTTKKRKY